MRAPWPGIPTPNVQENTRADTTTKTNKQEPQQQKWQQAPKSNFESDSALIPAHKTKSTFFVWISL